MKRICGTLFASWFLVFSSFAFAQERSFLEKSTEVKGYWKRDRVLPGSAQSIIPSQIHEVYGKRIDANVNFTQSVGRNQGGERISTDGPSSTFRGYIGGDILTLGLGGGLSQSKLKSDNSIEFSERVRSTKLIPQLGISFTPNITAGIASDVSLAQSKQTAEGIEERKYDIYTRRESLAISYHTPKMEFGIAYITPWSAAARSKDKTLSASVSGFGLTKFSDPDKRSVYLAPYFTAFARGNLNDQFSILGSTHYVQFDDNIEGSNPVFSDYRLEDRLAAQLQAVYWLEDLQTRVVASTLYRGATYCEFGTEDSGYSYRDTNQYGVSLDVAAGVADRTYVGLGATVLRGERDQDFNRGSGRASSREQFAKISTTLSKSF